MIARTARGAVALIVKRDSQRSFPSNRPVRAFRRGALLTPCVERGRLERSSERIQVERGTTVAAAIGAPGLLAIAVSDPVEAGDLVRAHQRPALRKSESR
jgi:hypothetical protein